MGSLNQFVLVTVAWSGIGTCKPDRLSVGLKLAARNSCPTAYRGVCGSAKNRW